MSVTRRRWVLVGLVVAVGVLTLAILSRVLATVFVAITVAYVLFPIRRELVARGLGNRVAAAVATAVAFVATAALLTPLFGALYLRREELLAFFENIPTERTVELFGFTYVVDVSRLVELGESVVISTAVGIARATPVLALKAFLFALLVYAILLRPGGAKRAVHRVVPRQYHDVVEALHVQVRDTLYALYVLQAVTAFGTFLLAYPVFWVLDYGSAFSLAVLSGILQFIPVLGPSLLVAALGLFEFTAGNTTGAILVVVLGLVFVAFLPDAVIRPRMASVTTGMPGSLYFIGFVGGTLTLGIIGVIAGPLVIALLVRTANLLAEERANHQTTLSRPAVGGTGEDGSGDGAEDDAGTTPVEDDAGTAPVEDADGESPG